jgi:Zn-dependent peptidase ImmA (M78 family)
MPPEDISFSKPYVVWLILNQQTEEALNLLAKHYGVNVPYLKVGLPKGHKKKAVGVYTSRNETISVFNSDILGNPFVILHEFYHHLRSKSVDKRHRGTERNADRFATDFLMEYQAAAAHSTR